jgi:hypothetical protein
MPRCLREAFEFLEIGFCICMEAIHGIQEKKDMYHHRVLRRVRFLKVKFLSFSTFTLLITIVLGSPDNGPICQESFWQAEDGTGGISPTLYAYLNRGYAYVPEYFGRPAEVCLHFFYGGRKHSNLGGICLHEQRESTQATLRFPEALQSPKYTLDILPLPVTLEQQSRLEELRTYCQSKCRCRSPEEEIEMEKEDEMLRVGMSQLQKNYGPKTPQRWPKRPREGSDDEADASSTYRSSSVPFVLDSILPY